MSANRPRRCTSRRRHRVRGELFNISLLILALVMGSIGVLTRDAAVLYTSLALGGMALLIGVSREVMMERSEQLACLLRDLERTDETPGEENGNRPEAADRPRSDADPDRPQADRRDDPR